MDTSRNILLSLIAFVLAVSMTSCASGTGDGPRTEQVTIGGRVFKLELATTSAERVKGLMYRPSIADDGGMIFVFPVAQHQSFWMSHTMVDLDIIFLDNLGYITAMHEMKAEPPKSKKETEAAYEARISERYPSVMPAQFAIELKGGTLRTLGLKNGEKIELDLKKLKAMAE